MVEEAIAALPSRTDRTGKVLLMDKQASNRILLMEGGERDVGKREPNTAIGAKRVKLKAGNCLGERSAINGAAANIVAARRTDGTLAKLQRVDLINALAGTVGVKVDCIQGRGTEVDSLVDLDRTLQF